MKRIISILFLLIIIILPLQVKALSVSENNITIEKGNKVAIDLYAEVEEEITQINFTLVYTSYDVPAYFNVASGLTDNMSGIKHQIIFSEPVSGKINLGTISINIVENPQVTAGTINVHSASAININNESITLNSQTITANVQKGESNEEPVVNNNDEPTVNNDNVENEDTPIDIKDEEKQVTNLLEKIESEIVDIQLKKDVYEYKVYIQDDLESLDLKPIVKNDKYKLEITSQKITELKNNQIIITVKDGDYTEEYKIKVSKLSEQEKIEIDESEFEPTYNYKGKWIIMIILLSIVLLVGVFFIKKQ